DHHAADLVGSARVPDRPTRTTPVHRRAEPLTSADEVIGKGRAGESAAAMASMVRGTLGSGMRSD
ncbi:hypothetical protein ACWC9T_41130, partial [Kitasatospora sp. NPDC001159]